MLRTVGTEEIVGLTQKLNPIRIILTQMEVTFRALDQKAEGNSRHDQENVFFFRISGVYKVSDFFFIIFLCC